MCVDCDVQFAVREQHFSRPFFSLRKGTCGQEMLTSVSGLRLVVKVPDDVANGHVVTVVVEGGGGEGQPVCNSEIEVIDLGRCRGCCVGHKHFLAGEPCGPVAAIRNPNFHRPAIPTVGQGRRQGVAITGAGHPHSTPKPTVFHALNGISLKVGGREVHAEVDVGRDRSCVEEGHRSDGRRGVLTAHRDGRGAVPSRHALVVGPLDLPDPGVAVPRRNSRQHVVPVKAWNMDAIKQPAKRRGELITVVINGFEFYADAVAGAWVQV